MDRNNIQIKKIFPIIAVLLLSISISGCEVIGDIFKAGIWVGVIIVVVIIVILFMIFKR